MMASVQYNQIAETPRISSREKYMYTFQGWIAFIAFMDIGIAIKSFTEKKCVFGEYSESKADKFVEINDPTLLHILGLFALMKAITLIHCTLYIHYKPVISITVCSLGVTIFMYLLEAIVYRSTTVSFHIIFPCLLNGVTIFGLIILPDKLLRNTEEIVDENMELAKKLGMIRKQRPCKKS